MKLLIEKKILVEGLNAVSKALSTKQIIPVLSGIKFDLDKKGLTLTATDNDITIQYFIDKKEVDSIDEAGSMVVYGKTMLDIVRCLPETKILIESYEGTEITFKTEDATYNFNCFPVNDFPNIILDESKEPIMLNTLKFKETINKTTFACSLQESRPILTGVNVKITANLLEVTATDSYRLSKISYNIDKEVQEPINIVINAKHINELVKIVSDDEELEMNVYSNKAIFRNKNITFQTSLLNGNYPNTDQSIAKEFTYENEVDQKEFYDKLYRASLLTQAKEKNIIDMEIKEDNLYIRAQSSGMGNVEEKMKIKNINNNNIKISFSAKFMLEALKMFEKDNIKLLLNGEVSPIILKNTDNNEMIQLILPMKTY